MQRHQILGCVSLFTLVLIFFILPPLSVSQGTENALFSQWKFPLAQFLSFSVLSFVFFVQRKLFPGFSKESEEYSKKDSAAEPEPENTAKEKRIKPRKSLRKESVINSSFFFISFGSLCLVSALLQGIAFLSDKSESQNVLKPEGVEWIFCILNFLFAAANEEILYRFFLPESLVFFSGFAKNENSKKILAFFSEILSAFVFALSHRYLGLFSVLNAFFAHGILRLCFRKTGKLGINVLSHFLYNFLSLLALSFA